MGILCWPRLVLVAFAATLVARLGNRLDGGLALAFLAVGWWVEWLLLTRLSRQPGVVPDVLLDAEPEPPGWAAGALEQAWAGGVLVLGAALSVCHFVWPDAVGVAAPLGVLALGHATGLRAISRTLWPLATARVAQAWERGVEPAELWRLVRAPRLVIAETGLLSSGELALVSVNPAASPSAPAAEAAPAPTSAAAEAADETEPAPESPAPPPAPAPDGQVLRLAGAVLRQRLSPLANAVLAEVSARKLALPKVGPVTAWPGVGLSATVGDQEVALGGTRLCQQLGVELPAELPPLARGTQRWLVFADRVYQGHLVVSDEPNKEALALAGTLAALGGPRLTLLSETCIELDPAGVFVSQAQLPPAAQPEDDVADWPDGRSALLTPARLTRPEAALRVVVGEGTGELSLPADQLGGLAGCWTLARQVQRRRMTRQRALLLYQTLVLVAALCALPHGLPLALLVGLDEVGLLVTLARAAA